MRIRLPTITKPNVPKSKNEVASEDQYQNNHMQLLIVFIKNCENKETVMQ